MAKRKRKREAWIMVQRLKRARLGPLWWSLLAKGNHERGGANPFVVEP